MNLILGTGFIFLISLLSARLIAKLKLPVVTAYIILGILIGPHLLNLAPGKLLSSSNLISNVVLGIIAFGIGQNFQISTFRKIGKSVMWISILESFGAWSLVTAGFFFIVNQPLYISLLFGAIAAATDPVATIMVIREYRTKGVFTDTLLSVVAIDDAWGLIIFALSLAISRALYSHLVAPSYLLKTFGFSLFEIFGAFLLGGVIAYLLSYLSKFIKTKTELLTFTLGFVLLTIGLAIKLNLSVLLANMFFGSVLVNINKSSFQFFDSLNTIDSQLFLLFFVIAGANLEIGLLPKLGVMGISYLLIRVVGKVSGAGLGGTIGKSPASVRKYIGLGLIPQAGVALACALIAKNDFPEVGNMIFSTIVATTVIYELVGPLCSKFALVKAGEITTGTK